MRSSATGRGRATPAECAASPRPRCRSEVYRLQGVHINDEHIGTIVPQMLQNVCIAEGARGAGDDDASTPPERELFIALSLCCTARADLNVRLCVAPLSLRPHVKMNDPCLDARNPFAAWQWRLIIRPEFKDKHAEARAESH